MKIIGSGLAGLLCGCMLYRHKPVILERQSALPNNHSAVLRFRSSVVGDTLGIPFKKVNLIKTPLPWRNPVADALAYSYKCTRQYLSDRSVTSGLVVEERFIAPPDLIAQMAQQCDITFNKDWDPHPWENEDEPIISTLPMPVLMKMLEYPDIPEFGFLPGVNVKATVDECDAYCSLLIPQPTIRASRISITGNELIIEIPNAQTEDIDGDHMVAVLCHELGLRRQNIHDVRVYEQAYQKIVPIDEDKRRRFIAWASDHYNIYSLGRFSTWRPKLLLDDLVQDIRKIEKWIRHNDHYDRILQKV